MANIGRKTKENETKREKFVRLAENRTDNALRNINLLGNLSNKSNYVEILPHKIHIKQTSLFEFYKAF